MSHPENENASESASAERFVTDISDETFTFQRVSFTDRKVTGAQIAAEFGKHPIENYVVLQHLSSNELETLRPGELTDLGERGRERFFVIEGDETWRFRASGLAMEWPRPSITAEQIVFLAGADEDSEVVLHRGDGPAEVFEGDDEVRLDFPGVEDIKIRPAATNFFVLVNGEEYTPPQRRMTPNQIITEGAEEDPATHYLVRTKKNGEPISYKDKGDEPIRLRKGMVFNTISTGPTPVSDPNFEKGPALFMRGLEALGYTPRRFGPANDHVAIDYVVPSGRFAGKEVRLGFAVPGDFPLTWPSGPHVSPLIHPTKTDGAHPTGGVHDSSSQEFKKAEKGEWQYWSRPYVHRGGMAEPVQAYLGHVLKLWDTQ